MVKIPMTSFLEKSRDRKANKMALGMKHKKIV